MGKRIVAISFIYACTTAGWFILAGTMVVRTEFTDKELRDAVGQLWGTKQTQQAPLLSYKSTSPQARNGQGRGNTEYVAFSASNIEVDLELEHRKKGLLWYSTYQVAFSGKYTMVNDSAEPREMFLSFEFPAKGAVYDNFRFVAGGREIQDIEPTSGNITKAFTLAGGETREIQISYESQGLDEWSYDFGSDVRQVRNFSLVLNTNFEEIDFPIESISPTDKQRTGDGWKLTWQYSNLLTGVKIAMVTPHKLNPGPWVSRVTAAAPVSLFLFFFLLFVLTTVRKIKVHPMNYFFIGTAFFSFHLLLAYLVDHISIHVAFWVCSVVSIFLVVSYMRLVLGMRFAFIEIAISQLVYLVFFSYTFFFVGYTGLAITILCICTLFMVMQLTGKVDWDDVFAKSSATTSNKAPKE
ncbi:MAG: inner membrane CreD family protein [Planctomycetota bacterium]|jgi:inner membrane protein involved in colicin E2 resistance